MDRVVTMLPQNSIATLSMNGFVHRLREAGVLTGLHCSSSWEYPQLWTELIQSLIGIVSNCLVPMGMAGCCYKPHLAYTFRVVMPHHCVKL